MNVNIFHVIARGPAGPTKQSPNDGTDYLVPVLRDCFVAKNPLLAMTAHI